MLSKQSYAQAGALDLSFNTSDLGNGIGDGASGIIHATAIQSDGKIIIGGDFTSYNGTATWRIARLNTDGSLDLTFNPSAGPDGSVYSVSIQNDGKIIIGGGFTSYNGTGRNRLARLNADGSLDASFDPGTGGSSGSINSTAIQSDGKIVIGGSFINYDGVVKKRSSSLYSKLQIFCLQG